MSRYGDYETAAPRRRGGYGAYEGGEERAPARRAPPRDDPYASERPLPPRIPASALYDTYRPPNLHGPSGSGSGSAPDRRDEYRRDDYGRRDPPSRAPASAYDTYRPTGRDERPSHRDERSSSRDRSYRDERGGGVGGYRGERDTYRGRGGASGRDDRDAYASAYPRRAPPENDYGAYATYRPPTKPGSEYERKLEKYAGVAPKFESSRGDVRRGRYRDDERDSRRSRYHDDDRDERRSRRSRRKDDSDEDSDDESLVRSRRSRKDKKKKKKNRVLDSDDDTEDDTDDESTEEDSSEDERRKKKKAKAKAKKAKAKKSKKKKDLSDSDDDREDEEDTRPTQTPTAMPYMQPMLALPAPDPAALGAEAFGGAGGGDLMGGEMQERAMVPALPPARADDFANMPGEYPHDNAPKGSLAGRFPQLGSAVATPMGPGVMTGQGIMPGMGGMPNAMGMQQMGMGMGMAGPGMQPQMMGAPGMQQMMGAPGMQPQMMGGLPGGMPGAMGGMPMQVMPMQQGMANGQDLLTQDMGAMNLGGGAPGAM